MSLKRKFDEGPIAKKKGTVPKKGQKVNQGEDLQENAMTFDEFLKLVSTERVVMPRMHNIFNWDPDAKVARQREDGMV